MALGIFTMLCNHHQALFWFLELSISLFLSWYSSSPDLKKPLGRVAWWLPEAMRLPVGEQFPPLPASPAPTLGCIWVDFWVSFFTLRVWLRYFKSFLLFILKHLPDQTSIDCLLPPQVEIPLGRTRRRGSVRCRGLHGPRQGCTL